MSHVLQVVPAYGRDYKSRKEILADWNAGKDFQASSIFDGHRLINKPDAIEAGYTGLIVRYGKLRKVTSINVDGTK